MYENVDLFLVDILQYDTEHKVFTDPTKLMHFAENKLYQKQPYQLFKESLYIKEMIGEKLKFYLIMLSS